MSTRAQIDANQANAQLSCGPKTDEGKAISAKNNTSHGLTGTAFAVMPWESQPDFDALRDELRNEHQPATITEQLLVDGLAEHHWLRQRAITLQRDCFDAATGKISDQKSFALYLRYETTHQRAFHKCLHDLLKLRAEKRKAEIGFESQKRQQEKHDMQQRRKELAVLTAGAHPGKPIDGQRRKIHPRNPQQSRQGGQIYRGSDSQRLRPRRLTPQKSAVNNRQYPYRA